MIDPMTRPNATQRTPRSHDALFPTSASITMPAHDDIAKRAYEIYLDKDRQEGQCEQNWLQAEKDLLTVIPPRCRPTAGSRAADGPSPLALPATCGGREGSARRVVVWTAQLELGSRVSRRKCFKESDRSAIGRDSASRSACSPFQPFRRAMQAMPSARARSPPVECR